MAGASAGGGWTVDNVDRGVTYDQEGELAFAVVDHPVIDYVKRILEESGESPLTEDDIIDGTNMYMMSATHTHKGMIDLKRELSGERLSKSEGKTVAARPVQEDLASVGAVLGALHYSVDMRRTPSVEWAPLSFFVEKAICHTSVTPLAHVEEETLCRVVMSVDQPLNEVSLAIWRVLECKNPKLTLQHVEKWLRKRELPLWIVGIPNPRPETTVSTNHDGSDAKYVMHVIARPAEDAMAEIIKMSGSYKQNFARLADTGVMILKSKPKA